MHALPPPGTDAEALLGLARRACPSDPAGWAVRQGVGALLADAGTGDGTLAESHRHAAVVWEALAVHLERVLAALDRAAIPALVLKGAAVALSHYARPAQRPMSDLDLLVRPAQWRGAASVLAALGFELDDPAEHGAGFAGPAGVRLELHGALTTCPGVFPVRFDDLMARSRALPSPFPGRRLGDEDLLLHAALHIAFQHGFRVRLGQVVDVARLAAGGLGWPVLSSLAERRRAWPCLASVLEVTSRLIGVTPPPDIGGSWRRHIPKPVLEWVYGCDGPGGLLDGMPLARARWALADGAVCRARLLAGTLWPGRPDGRREVSPWKALARGRRLLNHLR
ncbi:MAG TPA: nucleotidyltransferase family protein [Vicinamibacteria bacterium]